jgi:hypothetical protein
MENKIHIKIYYNLIYSGYTDSYEQNDIITYSSKKIDFTFPHTEIAIITDEEEVRRIIQHPKTKINDYGEFIDYDCEFLKGCICNDFFEYKEKDSLYKIDYEFKSFYYVKCEVVKNISNELKNYLYF